MESKTPPEGKPSTSGAANNTGSSDQWTNCRSDEKVSTGPFVNASADHQRSHAKQLAPWDWVPVCSTAVEDDWYTTSWSKSEVSAGSSGLREISPWCGSGEFGVSEGSRGKARFQELDQMGRICDQEKRIESLEATIAEEKEMRTALGAQLFGLFVTTIRDRQQEIGNFQERLMGLQSDAKEWTNGVDWKKLHVKLLQLKIQLHENMKNTTQGGTSVGYRTEKLSLFLDRLSTQLPKLWRKLDGLGDKIEEAKTFNFNSFGDEAYCPPQRSAPTEFEDDIDAGTQCSVTDSLNHCHGFSRCQQRIMMMRKNKLQKLMEETMTELGRLQADLQAIDIDVPLGPATTPPIPARKVEEDEVQTEEAEDHEVEEDGVEKHEVQNEDAQIEDAQENEVEKGGVKEVPETAGHSFWGTDAQHIVHLQNELEFRDVEIQALESYFASAQQEHEAAASMKQRVHELDLVNKKFRQGMREVADKLVQHRTNLWGLSKQARELGEELIGMMEKAGIFCCGDDETY